MNKYNSIGFNLASCPVCGDLEPMAYAEGMAKKIFDGNGNAEMYFSEVDGYVVECQECGTRTKHYQILQDAVGAWNNNEVIKE